MITAHYKKYKLDFKQASGTSRGILHTKETFFIILRNSSKIGIGECAVFKGLSVDDTPDYEEKLHWVCNHINLGLKELLLKTIKFPSIQFGLEQAFLSLENPKTFDLFPSKFTQSKDNIPINGLIWMGDKAFMKEQIVKKLKAGFTTIKLKIGAIDFKSELLLLKYIRNEFSKDKIALRVDANGAFSVDNAMQKLTELAQYDLHSIEQPIKVKQWEEMAKLCATTPLPIALDEELIGIFKKSDKERLLKEIKPQYIILKPSLIGGIYGSDQWIELAEKHDIKWWITSALESNIGLNAIAQYTYNLKTDTPQGLGTGELFTNNINSPLQVKNGSLHYNNSKKWELKNIDISI